MQNLKKVTSEITNEWLEYYWLEEDLKYKASELFLENYWIEISYNDIELDYSFWYSQSDYITIKNFSLRTPEILKSLLFTKDISQGQHDILLEAHEWGCFEFWDDYNHFDTLDLKYYCDDKQQKELNKFKKLIKKHYPELYKEHANKDFIYDTLFDAILWSYGGGQEILNRITSNIEYDLKKCGYNLIEAEDEHYLKENTLQEFFDINDLNLDACDYTAYLKHEINDDGEYILINDNKYNDDVYIKKSDFDDLDIEEKQDTKYINKLLNDLDEFAKTYHFNEHDSDLKTKIQDLKDYFIW